MPSQDRTTGNASSDQYRRVLLKVSGEALMGGEDYGLDPDTVARIAAEISSVTALGLQVCVVIGGGNIFRGVSGAAAGMERVSADYMGMLATVINAVAMQSALESHGTEARVLSAIGMQEVCEPYIRRRAVRHMEKGRIVICAAGTGNPFFTTDTAAALRAAELDCDVILKATKVDGVYSDDPVIDEKAEFLPFLTYGEVLSANFGIMDTAAIALSRDKDIPIIVFSIYNKGMFAEAVQGRGKFTLIGREG